MASTSIAWNWLVFAFSFILLGIIMIVMTFIFNYLSLFANADITTGLVTHQQLNIMTYAQSWWTYAPYFFIIIGFVAMIIGAVQNKGSSP